MADLPNTFRAPFIRLYAITHKTKDFGEKYVVRGHTIYPSGKVIADAEAKAACDTLEHARGACRGEGATLKIPRNQRDVVVIVESWM